MSQPEHSDRDEYTEPKKEALDQRADDVLDDESEEWADQDEYQCGRLFKFVLGTSRATGMGSNYEFRIHPGAAADLKSAPADVRERIRKKLRGTRNDIYRIRIGGYRVAFVVAGNVVGIVGADKRSGAYGNVDTFDDRADEFSG